MIDKAKIVKLRGEIDKALKSVGEKYGVVLKAGNASYTAELATFKLNVAVMSNGVPVSKEESDYKFNQKFYDLPELFSKIVVNGEEYTIIGFRARSYVAPVLVKKTKNGKRYRMPVKIVKELLGNTSK